MIVSNAPQDLAAVARRGVLPLDLLLVRGRERGDGVVGSSVGNLAERLAGRRVLHGDRPALGAVAPLAADVQPLLDAVQDGLLFLALHRCRHVATVSAPSSSEMATSSE